MHGRGQNALGMSLRTYVLADRLKQVADAAGQRLDRMSAGRYTFVHSTDREARGKAGGLGLDILDGWSGLVRPTKTLSGGESFLASLALALGLADVVAAEAGGRVLDTLFVDEGFGSLDPDTLDLVMGTLDELRAGGRVVGVVSHVDELRQRIPSQVRVCRTPQGSTLAGHHRVTPMCRPARYGMRADRDHLMRELRMMGAHRHRLEAARVPADRALPGRPGRVRRAGAGRTRPSRSGCWPRSRTPGCCAGAGRPRTPNRLVLVAEFDTAAGYRRAQSPLEVRRC